MTVWTRHRRGGPVPPPAGSPRLHGGAPPVLVAVVLLALLVAEVATPRWAAAEHDVSPAEIVPAVTAAYGDVGTFAVVVARQEERLTDGSIRAIEGHSARVLARTAGSEQADRPFPTASLVKLFLAEDVLHRARTGAVTLTPEDRAQLEVMIRGSNDPAASDVWVRFGGAQAVRDVATRYGLTGTAPPLRWGQWGETTTTAADLARFLTRLPVIAHPDDAAALQGWMGTARSEEHTSELQSRQYLVCRLLLEKTKKYLACGIVR